MANQSKDTSNRGLASADEKTRKKVASMGGSAPHQKRGQSGSDNSTQGQ